MIYYFYVYECFVLRCVYVQHVYQVLEELQTIVGCHRVAGNRTRVLWKDRPYS